MRSIKTLSAKPSTINDDGISTIASIKNQYTMIQTLHSQIEEAWQQTTVEHVKTLLPAGQEVLLLSKPTNKSGFIPISFAVWKGATVDLVYYLYKLNKEKSLVWKSSNSQWNLLHYLHHCVVGV